MSLQCSRWSHGACVMFFKRSRVELSSRNGVIFRSSLQSWCVGLFTRWRPVFFPWKFELQAFSGSINCETTVDRDRTCVMVLTASVWLVPFRIGWRNSYASPLHWFIDCTLSPSAQVSRDEVLSLVMGRFDGVFLGEQLFYWNWYFVVLLVQRDVHCCWRGIPHMIHQLLRLACLKMFLRDFDLCVQCRIYPVRLSLQGYVFLVPKLLSRCWLCCE